jgi:hypothetical protein
MAGIAHLSDLTYAFGNRITNPDANVAEMSVESLKLAMIDDNCVTVSTFHPIGKDYAA